MTTCHPAYLSLLSSYDTPFQQHGTSVSASDPGHERARVCLLALRFPLTAPPLTASAHCTGYRGRGHRGDAGAAGGVLRVQIGCSIRQFRTPRGDLGPRVAVPNLPPACGVHQRAVCDSVTGQAANGRRATVCSGANVGRRRTVTGLEPLLGTGTPRGSQSIPLTSPCSVTARPCAS